MVVEIKKAAEPGVVPKKVGPVDVTESKDVEMEPPPEEHEKDDKADSRPKITNPCITNDFDATLDAFVSGEGCLITALTAEGFQYLASGARGTVGLKGGRYVFEVKGIEYHNPVDPTGRNRQPQPRHVIRIGFSKARSHVIMREDTESVCFDNEGVCFIDGKKIPSKKRFAKDDVVACLLNLDSKSKNANTISLFINGVRAWEPQPLPDALKGVALFPTITFKNVSMAVNYSNTLWKPLPFKCRGISDAAKADTEETKVVRPKDGKYEVVYPIAIPEEGFFDWCDEFLEKNPQFVELSDRKILDWCEASGLRRNNAMWMSNLDKPNFNFGVPHIDDLSCRKIINLVAATTKRHILVGELKGNLLPEERAESLKRFPASVFKKIAKVIIGEPDAKFKKAQQEMMKKQKSELAETKRKAEESKLKAEQMRKISDHKRKKVEEKKQKLAEKNAAKLAKLKEETLKKAEEAQKKLEEEEAKKEEGAEKKEEGDAEMKPAEEPAKEEKKDEEMKEEKEEEEEEKEDEELKELEKEIVVELKPEDLELTAEEKKLSFRSKQTEDVSARLLADGFTKFSLPDASEGFTSIEFPWSKEKPATDRLATWIKEQKICLRIENLQPSEWFREKNEAFISERDALKKHLHDFLAQPPAEDEPMAEEKPAEAEADKPAEEGAAAAEGEEGEKKPAEEPKEAPKPQEPEIKACENIKDADGKGKPLFAKWDPEDWQLLNIRFELHLLMHAFKKDVDDAERPGIPELHALFYYNKYYRRPFSTQYYGVASLEDLLALLPGTAELKDFDKWKVLEPAQYDTAPIDTFVKLTEEARRERKRRLDAGDETARLKISIPPPPQQRRTFGGGGGGGKQGGKVPQGAPFNFQPGPQPGLKRGFDQGPGFGGGNFGKGGKQGGKQGRWGKPY